MTDKRLTKADFTAIDDLPRYGVDEPTPTSFDELRCNYKEDKKNDNPLILTDLEGYCVPPDGIVTVGVNGVGLQAGWAGLIYPAGTFREDKYTLNKEFGITPLEGTRIRHEQRKSAATDALATWFKDKGIEILDDTKGKDAQVVAALAVWVAGFIDEKKNPKEALNLFKYYWDKQDKEQGILDGLPDVKEVAVRSLETIDKLLDKLDKEIDNKKSVIEAEEGEFYDVD